MHQESSPGQKPTWPPVLLCSAPQLLLAKKYCPIFSVEMWSGGPLTIICRILVHCYQHLFMDYLDFLSYFAINQV